MDRREKFGLKKDALCKKRFPWHMIINWQDWHFGDMVLKQKRYTIR